MSEKRPSFLGAHGAGVWGGLVLALVGLGVLNGTGCTLINSTESVQCHQQSDCTSRGEAFADSICGAEGVCISASLVGVGGQGGAAGAAGGGGGGSGGGESGTGGCQIPKDCIDQGKGQCLCRANECVPLTTKECAKTVGFLENENPEQVLGVMLPRYGNKALVGDSYVAALQTALDEYRQAVQKINQKTPLLVVCDEINNPEAAATHLLETVQTKVVIGPTWDDAIQKLSPRFQQAGVISLLPISDNPSLEEQGNPTGQTWACKPNRASIGPYWTAVAQEAEKIIKKRSPTIETLQVTMLAARDPSSQALATIVSAKKAFANFSRLDYDDYRVTDVAYGSVVSPVVNAAATPNLIIIISSGDGASDVMLTIENTWTSKAAPRPYYLIIGGAEGISTALGKQVLGSNLGDRVLSLDFARSDVTTQAYQEFVSAYGASNKAQSPRPESEFFYDCFWLNEYALLAATGGGKTPLASLDGATYSSVGIAAVDDPNGTPQRVGIDGAADTLVSLQSGATVNLNGAGSALDIDRAKGTPQARGSLGCVVNNLTRVASGLEFDGGGLVAGTVNANCP